MASQVQNLHFLLIPLMSQSHIIPLTDFAKLLARHGPVVSIITTPLNALRFQEVTDYAKMANLKIQLIPIRFPAEEAGLPEGCENLDLLPSKNSPKQFFTACSMLQEPIQNLAQNLEPKPSCIISTSALPWTQNLAQKLKIPRYIFHTVSCFTLLCSDRISKTEILHSANSDTETFLLPDMPHEIEFTKSQLPEVLRSKSDELKGILDSMKEVENLAEGSLVNSFEELDPWYVEQLKKVNKNFWCIGPVSLCNKKTSDPDQNCLKWLDSMRPKSVIYACFGSLCRLSFRQLREIGFGLESSGCPFIWIIREVDYSPEVQKWLKDDKFEERVEGLVIRGWAPQVLILSHPSIGGFLTHCGWNSTMEAVCSGVPMITWPMFAEQFYNEKFVLNVLRIGVRIGVEKSMDAGQEEEVLVKSEKIRAAIDQLMDETEAGEEIRKRARELSRVAKNAIEEGGSSYNNTTLLIQDVLQIRFTCS